MQQKKSLSCACGTSVTFLGLAPRFWTDGCAPGRSGSDWDTNLGPTSADLRGRASVLGVPGAGVGAGFLRKAQHLLSDDVALHL